MPAIRPTAMITKPAYFRDCVLQLPPVDQRLVLLDLCNSPPKSTHEMPAAEKRSELRSLLFQLHGTSPVGNSLSSLSLRGLRENWWKIGSRIAENPDAAITSARTLLESTCKTILVERSQVPEESGELSRLVKQTTRTLGFAEDSQGQLIKQLVSGIMGVVGAIAGISNASGDRHGLVAGETSQDICLAECVANACGVLAVFLTRRHMLHQLGAATTATANE